MKQLLKTIIRNVKNARGNSLAEFATTTALMATLAATAAPKLSEMSEGAKGEKSRNEIDKIVKMAGQFYQDIADTEGRGRFPNQKKFNVPIGDANGNGGDSDANTEGVQYSFSSDTSNSGTHTRKILRDLGIADAFRIDADGDGTVGDDELETDLTQGWDRYSEDPQSDWQSVFGFGSETTTSMGISSKVKDAENHNDGTAAANANEWDNLFGDEVLGSTFQDGHYVYAVVAGGGTGADVYPPTIYVVDIESAVDFNNVLMP